MENVIWAIIILNIPSLTPKKAKNDKVDMAVNISGKTKGICRSVNNCVLPLNPPPLAKLSAAAIAKIVAIDADIVAIFMLVYAAFNIRSFEKTFTIHFKLNPLHTVVDFDALNENTNIVMSGTYKIIKNNVVIIENPRMVKMFLLVIFICLFGFFKN